MREQRWQAKMRGNEDQQGKNWGYNEGKLGKTRTYETKIMETRNEEREEKEGK